MRSLRYILLSSLVLTSTLSLPSLGHAQNSDKDLTALTNAEKSARKDAAALDKKRKSVGAEIDNLQNSLKKIARETRVFEKDAQTLAQKKRKIDITIARLTATIKTDHEDLIELLSALQRLEANPPPAMVMRPDDAITSAQAGQLMAALTEQLGQRTKTLKIQLEALSQEQLKADDTQKQIDANTTQLKKRRTQTLALVNTKSDLQKSIDKQRAEKEVVILKLAKEAATLKELLETLRLEANRVMPRLKPGKGKGRTRGRALASAPVTLPNGVGPFSKAKGRLNLPVEGRLKHRFGGGEKGLTFTAQSEGQVLAPYAGRVEFAGPFKNYDQVVILAVGDGYYILLTGLGQIYAETGESVRQGDPIGVLPYNRNGNDELYLELRKNGKTLDPAPWLAL